MFDFAPDFNRLDVDYLKTLNGPCADKVQEASHELVRFADGTMYRISRNGGALIPAPEVKSSFVADGLEPQEIPVFGSRRFIDADRYLSATTTTGGEERYVGLWSDGKRWTVATFATPAGGGGGEVRCVLFHSSLRVRGLNFFPAPDTAAGQLWMVQDGPSGETRVVTIGWRHEGIAMDGTAPDPCEKPLSGGRGMKKRAADDQRVRREAGREPMANDVARAIAASAGLPILDEPPGGYSTEEPLVFSVPADDGELDTDAIERAVPD